MLRSVACTLMGSGLQGAVLALLVGASAPQEDGAPARDPLARVGVLGASASAGFNLVTEFGAAIDFGDVLACVLPAETAPLVEAVSNALFLDPVRRGTELVEKLREADPSLVVAVDFPFWFGCGVVAGGDEARLARLETGLALLDRLECALVVGDFPDVSRALDGRGPFGPMIHAGQVPGEEARAALNRRLAAWAEARGDVVVIPLGDALAAFAEGRVLELRGNSFGTAPLSRWLQADLLHPTVEGTIALAVLVFDRFVGGHPELESRAWSWGAAEVRRRLEEETAEERAERQERRRRREERRQGLKEERADDPPPPAPPPPTGGGQGPPDEPPRLEEPPGLGVRPKPLEEVPRCGGSGRSWPRPEAALVS